MSSIAGMVIPQAWILRPLLSVLGYGLYGPIKGRQSIDNYRRTGLSYDGFPGSPAAWAQLQFWGAAVQKGSWFAILQRAGMKGVSSSIRPMMGVIGGTVGALFRKVVR